MKEKILNQVLTLLIFFTALIFLNCSSTVVYEIKPEGGETFFYQGREVSVYSDSIAETNLNFENFERNEYAFYLYIRNNSSADIEINPAIFYYEATERIDDKSSKDEFTKKYKAIDPEQKLAFIEKELKNAEAVRKTESCFNCFFAAIGAAATITTSNSPGETISELGETAAIYTDIETKQQISYSQRKASLESDKMFWMNEALRRTTLKPGNEIGGLIFTPPEFNAGKLIFRLSLNNTIHEHAFRQTRFYK